MRHGQRKAFEQPDVPRPRELPLAAAIERPIPKVYSDKSSFAVGVKIIHPRSRFITAGPAAGRLLGSDLLGATAV